MLSFWKSTVLFSDAAAACAGHKNTTYWQAALEIL